MGVSVDNKSPSSVDQAPKLLFAVVDPTLLRLVLLDGILEDVQCSDNCPNSNAVNGPPCNLYKIRSAAHE